MRFYPAPPARTQPTAAEEVVRPIENSVLPLSLHDVCDAEASGVVQALVRLVSPTGRILDLCKHHADAHELALLEQGWRLAHDRRRDLTSNDAPTVPAQSGVSNA